MDKEEEFRNDSLFNLLEIIKARKFGIIIGFLCVFAVTVVGAFLMPVVYEASTKISISLPTTSKSADIPYLEELGDIKTFVGNQPVVASSRLIYEKVALNLNLHKRDETRSFLGKLKDMFFKKNIDLLEEAINGLYDSTEISLIRGTNILYISAHSGSSEGAANIANTLAKTYTDYANSLMFNRAKIAYDTISRELESVHNSLNTSQNALDGLKKSLNIVEGPIMLKNMLTQYSAQYEEIQETIQNLENRQIQEKMRKLEEPIPHQSSNVKKVKSEKIRQIQPTESPKVMALKSRIKNLKNELEIDLRRYTEKHPNVKKLRGDIATLEEELSQEEKASPAESVIQPETIIETEMVINAEPVIRTEPILNAGPDINELKRKRDILSKQIQTLESKLLKVSIMEPELEKISREVNKKELEYAMVKQKLDSARILKDQTQEGTIKIFDPASPPSYASNKKKMILLIVGFIASIIFGLGIGFIAEYFEDVFKSPEEIEKSLNLPILAAIPTITKKMLKGKKKYGPKQSGDYTT